MFRIPRRFAHFVYGVIQSGVTTAIATGVASFGYLAAVCLDHDVADCDIRRARYPKAVVCYDMRGIGNRGFVDRKLEIHLFRTVFRRADAHGLAADAPRTTFFR
jgi:hypothetical protein